MADAGVKRKGFPQRSKEANGILRSGSLKAAKGKGNTRIFQNGG
jgi:hypothetical protein